MGRDETAEGEEERVSRRVGETIQMYLRDPLQKQEEWGRLIRLLECQLAALQTKLESLEIKWTASDAAEQIAVRNEVLPSADAGLASRQTALDAVSRGHTHDRMADDRAGTAVEKGPSLPADDTSNLTAFQCEVIPPSLDDMRFNLKHRARCQDPARCSCLL
eukprot:gnl/TRDRNA2_/TRDRNA2_45689_c0_seq1.p1 gnl/TRDRNA2_/TRDRNA2_45689_c0~~gnl/TRDRNA2_/TRDRNA2_45689_c0_seq1.p1  ORF type:complete len:178 (+),score=20.54 gnl/TRDRNA2_/TRDRNA2_45689_c0_seq1:50-535(+)